MKKVQKMNISFSRELKNPVKMNFVTVEEFFMFKSVMQGNETAHHFCTDSLSWHAHFFHSINKCLCHIYSEYMMIMKEIHTETEPFQGIEVLQNS